MSDNKEKPTMTEAHQPMDQRCECELCSGRMERKAVQGPRTATQTRDLEEFLLNTFTNHSWAHIRFLHDKAGISWSQIHRTVQHLTEMIMSAAQADMRAADLKLFDQLRREGKI